MFSLCDHLTHKELSLLPFPPDWVASWLNSCTKGGRYSHTLHHLIASCPSTSTVLTIHWRFILVEIDVTVNVVGMPSPLRNLSGHNYSVYRVSTITTTENIKVGCIMCMLVFPCQLLWRQWKSGKSGGEVGKSAVFWGLF